MRFMLTFRIPKMSCRQGHLDKGNAAVRDGSLGDVLQSILEDLRPEAAYFAEKGKVVENCDDKDDRKNPEA